MIDAPAWLAPAFAYLQQWLEFQVRTTEQPGVAIAVALRGEVVLDSAYGLADLATGEALTPRHRFRAASHSKSFTAAAILKLREQGRIRMDDLAGYYVSGLHPEVASASIAQLLSHSAGIVRDGPDCAYWDDRAPFLDATSLRTELAAAPVIDASTRLKYSNHGYGLVGMVVEAVAGEPYGAWVQREIIDAAGLMETTPDVPLPAGAKLASGHGGKAPLGRRPVIPGNRSTYALAPATGLVSTAADLARFYGLISPRSGTSILSVASRREMARLQWRDPWVPLAPGYGLGLMIGGSDGWDWLGHLGGFPGYVTRTAVVPLHDLAISCLTNASDGMAYAWLDGAMAILRRFQEEGPPSAAVGDWRGRWWNVDGATDLVAMGEKVILASPGLTNPFIKRPELSVTAPDVARISQSSAFVSYGEPVRRLRGPDGAVAELQIAGSRLVTEPAFAAELVARYES